MEYKIIDLNTPEEVSIGNRGFFRACASVCVRAIISCYVNLLKIHAAQ